MSTSNPAVRRIALFAAVSHLARMADPRVSEPPADSIKAINERLKQLRLG